MRASSIRRLDPRIVSEINGLFERGRTLNEILAKLRELGVSDVSRSALGRYKQSYDEVIASVRESRQVAEVLVKEFGKDSDPKAMARQHRDDAGPHLEIDPRNHPEREARREAGRHSFRRAGVARAGQQDGPLR